MCTQTEIFVIKLRSSLSLPLRPRNVVPVVLIYADEDFVMLMARLAETCI